MDDESLVQRVLHLRQVEHLSHRQIADALGIGRKRVRRMLKAATSAPGPLIKRSMLDGYRNLIAEWYQQYPRLMAKQVYERLVPYGYTGSYISVARITREYRKVKQKPYYPLIFLPGEEAQVDWFSADVPGIGRVSGFLYVLSYSRYAWGMFYQRTTFEFFLAGHLACFDHLGGLARRHRYDNLKSVVLSRDADVIRYNPQFLEFARFFGFSIHACNPYSGNEKGRVERLVRAVRGFLYGETFKDIADLNAKFHVWLQKRNASEHRSTEKTPMELRAKERLLAMPAQPYLARRVEVTGVLSTAQVECDSNKYSVPSSCTGQAAELCIYPSLIEVWVSSQKVATHKRCFERRQAIQNPLHEEKQLNRTPNYKMRRIYQGITGMDPVFLQFVSAQDEESQEQTAYELFTLLKTHGRMMIVSAVRELNAMGCYKVRALHSRLNLPEARAAEPVWPKDLNLLNLKYQERSLDEYNPNT